MVVYLAGFAISLLFFWFHDKTKGVLQGLFSVIGLTVPCMIAALRDKTIGTDIATYAANIFHDASAIPDWYSMSERWIHGWLAQPTGYVIFTWVTAKIVNDFHFYLFMLQLITIVPFFFALKYFASNSMCLGMFYYFMLVYPPSLNIMKQTAAATLVFLSLVFCDKKNMIGFSLMMLLAFSFHQTAIIMVIIYPIYQQIVNNRKQLVSSETKLKIYAIIFLLIVGISLFSNRLIALLPTIKGSYQFILDNSSTTNFNADSLVFVFLILVMDWFSNKGDVRKKAEMISNIKESNQLFLFELFTVVGFLSSELSMFADGLDRISVYGIVFTSLYFGLVIKRKTSLDLSLLQIVFISFTIIHFIRFMLAGYGQLYPYTSSLLGITANNSI